MWEADLLLCVLLYVIHLAGGSPLGPLKQTSIMRDAENTLPLFHKIPHRYFDKDVHIFSHAFTPTHQRSCLNSYQRSDAFHVHADTWVINGQSVHGMFWHAHTPTLTILSQSACMCEVLYRGLGSASRYFVLSVFHCSSDQKPWRLLACSQMYTEASGTATATKQGQNNRG